MDTSGKVRISTALSAGEKQAIAKRKYEVKKGLDNLGITGGKIPTIAVLGSGGGLRAMIALYGTLTELKNQNLLDCVMYLGGVSGSTWCMSKLYKHTNWSEYIKNLETKETEILTHGHWDFLKARAAAIEATEDKNYSLTDFWAFFIVHDLLKQMDESKLSEQRRSSENGKNPYPIYAAVDYNRFISHQPGSWYEFTPHEVGIAGLGASINTKDFGSKFENGLLKEEKKERIVCYLQGLWGSALGSKKEIENVIYDKLTHLSVLERRYTSGVFSSGTHERRSMALPSRINPATLSATDVSGLEEKRRRLENELKMMFRGAESSSVFSFITDWAYYLWEMLKCLYQRIWGTTNESCRYISLNCFYDFPQYVWEILEWLYKWIWGTTNHMYNSYCPHYLLVTLKCLCQWVWGTTDNMHNSNCGDNIWETLKCFYHSIMGTSNGTRATPNWTRGTSNGARRPSYNSSHSYLKSCLWETLKCVNTWTWGTTNNFLYHCSEVDSPELINEPVVHLIDAGVAINTAYPLILRPEREVDLILSFDFSNGDPFKTLTKTAEYCEADGNTGLRFPKINVNDLQDKDNPLDCYVFRGKGAATVMHFPLFNRVNCPGEIEEYHKQFSTLSLEYSEQEIEKLLTAAKMNVTNVQQKIFEEIRHIVRLPGLNYKKS